MRQYRCNGCASGPCVYSVAENNGEIPNICPQQKACVHWKESKDFDVALMELMQTLLFYGSPDTYFAVSLVPDSPCGDIMNDLDETGKPGKLARETLEKVCEALSPYFLAGG